MGCRRNFLWELFTAGKVLLILLARGFPFPPVNWGSSVVNCTKEDHQVPSLLSWKRSEWFLSAGMGANYLWQLVKCPSFAFACRDSDVVGAYVLVNNLILLRDHFDISDAGNIGPSKFVVPCVLSLFPAVWGVTDRQEDSLCIRPSMTEGFSRQALSSKNIAPGQGLPLSLGL